MIAENAKAGFTLMEVCVALAVLSAGVLVFGRYLDGFNRVRMLERQHANAAIVAAQAVEHFVQYPPECRDATFAFGALADSIQVTLQTIPGPRQIVWLNAFVVTPSVRTTPKAPVFRRIVRCAR
ncbi:prepilin-type N-terminal cleavage/methylation domain-containing protein [Fibrobacter sp. UWB10]|nr:prepilin-type N-terminal cleavage/methylation domain-containing protein [Fibrobacter sp. UWB10]